MIPPTAELAPTGPEADAPPRPGEGPSVSPLRVNFVLPVADMSGGVRVIAQYAERLRGRGHEVTVISQRRRYRLRSRVAWALRGQPLGKLVPVQPSHLDNTAVTHRVLGDERRVRPADLPDADVTVATYWRTAAWVADLPPEKGAGVYLVQHDERQLDDGGDPGRIEATWRLDMTKVVVAEWLRPLLIDHGSDDRVVVVPNAVEHERFHAPPRGKNPRFTVGLMHSPARFKGTDLALSAISIAREKLGGPEGLDVVAFGKTEPGDDLSLPAGSRFTPSPTAEQIREAYASCDAWLVASRSEGFGLPILEAMACRTPVIAGPTGAAPQLLPGGGGWLVDPPTAAGFAEVIVAAARLDDASWRERSDRARAAASGLTWDAATDRFEAVLRAAAAAAGGRG